MFTDIGVQLLDLSVGAQNHQTKLAVYSLTYSCPKQNKNEVIQDQPFYFNVEMARRTFGQIHMQFDKVNYYIFLHMNDQIMFLFVK